MVLAILCVSKDVEHTGSRGVRFYADSLLDPFLEFMLCEKSLKSPS